MENLLSEQSVKFSQLLARNKISHVGMSVIFTSVNLHVAYSRPGATPILSHFKYIAVLLLLVITAFNIPTMQRNHN